MNHIRNKSLHNYSSSNAIIIRQEAWSKYMLRNFKLVAQPSRLHKKFAEGNLI